MEVPHHPQAPGIGCTTPDWSPPPRARPCGHGRCVACLEQVARARSSRIRSRSAVGRYGNEGPTLPASDRRLGARHDAPLLGGRVPGVGRRPVVSLPEVADLSVGDMTRPVAARRSMREHSPPGPRPLTDPRGRRGHRLRATREPRSPVAGRPVATGSCGSRHWGRAPVRSRSSPRRMRDRPLPMRCRRVRRTSASVSRLR